ncbi:MFS transporter [Prescottella agglutinans]|uniref:MFS transporter n=1 Tax=Prescottella agglutinans TaxID=1644129 RepID=A0A438BHS6_9NOCA|nr:MFS transporter [Prescottella agglutinans]RVW10417.1 MFS transporter [Prescottella agglutinans]
MSRPAKASASLLTATLCFVILVVSTQQTIVMPLSSVIGHQLDIGTTAIGWTITSGFLAAAVMTPVAGRMADLRRKRTVLLGVLTIMLAGSVLAAVTESLPLLILARVLQGVSFAAFPVGLAILRDELPPRRLASAMGLLSGTLGFGGGVGMVLTGLVVPAGADYRRAFWLATALTVIAIVAVIAVVPSRPNPAPGRVDWTGAVLLGAGLVLILLPLSEGGSWGWASPRTIGCAVAGIVVLAGWFAFERRIAQPLVPTEMLTRRPVVCTHLAGLLVGAGMFVNITALTYFVQTTRAATGYGFDAGPMQAGLVYILPGATIGVVVSICSGALINRFGARAVMAASGVLGVVGFCSLIVAHDTTWQVIGGSMVASAFTSLGYAAMPALLVAEVDRDQTGVANSVNSIARTAGSSVASALLATLLAALTIGDTAYARVDAYLVAFGFGAVCAVVAPLLVFVGTSGRRRTDEPTEPDQSASLASMSRADSAVLGSQSTS